MLEMWTDFECSVEISERQSKVKINVQAHKSSRADRQGTKKKQKSKRNETKKNRILNCD